MGYAYYIINGRERGYAIDATCDEVGCKTEIDRGLAYACGHSPYEETDSCANYFCADHMFFTTKGQRCARCVPLVKETEE